MKQNLIVATLSLLICVISSSAQSSVDALNRANTFINDVGRRLAPDKRQAIYELKAFNNPDGILVVSGTVSDSTMRKELVEALNNANIDYSDKISVLPSDKWALVRLSVASMRTEGRHPAEMATQATMGTPLRLLRKNGLWWQVQCPDGYIAWAPEAALAIKSPEEMDKWRNSHRFIISRTGETHVYRTSSGSGPRDVITDLVNGSIVSSPGSASRIENGRLEIATPDGRTGYIDATSLQPIEEWAGQEFNPDVILDTAFSLMGTPYLWGGTSTKGMDCSGLTKISYFANGIILMRDASQQAKTGKRIEANDWRRCAPGDLLFFGNAAKKKVTHVGIYDRNGNFIHSSGRVRVNSIVPDADNHLSLNFLHAVRISGMEETDGIIRARNHPWYFNH